MPRTAKPKPQKTLEQRLWDAADALRGNQEPSEYKHVVLGLVFLKHISDRFEERRQSIEGALADPDSDEYIPNPERRTRYLEEAINKYTNRSLTTAEIIAELVKLAKELRDDANRHQALGLREDEVAFYDAIAPNESAVLAMGDHTLKKIAHELVAAVQASATIDWNLRDSVRAAMRLKVRKLLDRYDYPPDHEEKAIDLVLQQAELFASSEAA